MFCRLTLDRQRPQGIEQTKLKCPIVIGVLNQKPGIVVRIRPKSGDANPPILLQQRLHFGGIAPIDIEEGLPGRTRMLVLIHHRAEVLLDRFDLDQSGPGHLIRNLTARRSLAPTETSRDRHGNDQIDSRRRPGEELTALTLVAR
jgi:hypothetical protein